MAEELRIPGPTPCPPEILQAMARQMIDHRGSEFVKIMQRITEKVKQVFQTKNDVLTLTGSGTGGMEAMVVNTLSPGDRVLIISIGSFGDRLINIAKAFGADVVPMNVEWGRAADPDAIRKVLESDTKIKTVMITHNETSTGVTNDLGAISKVVKGLERLLVVDAISSMSSINCPVDEWNLDVVASGSQKGWMVPPGLVFVSVSEEAWKAHAAAKMPRVYWDFKQAKTYLERGQTPWTPAVSIVFAMDVALDMILKEGLDNVFARHAQAAKAAREGVNSLGLTLYGDERHASNTVTAVNVPAGVEVRNLRKILREEHKVVLAGGQGKIEDKIFRIGHLGWVDERNIKTAITALRAALPKAGFAVKD
jgi:aspartate aminotransferase-like enzyme